MRSDTPLCYPVGEPCDQGLLFDEMHEAILIGTLGTLTTRVERLRDELGWRHLALFPGIPLLAFAPARRSPCLFAGEFMSRFATGKPRHRSEHSVARAEVRP